MKVVLEFNGMMKQVVGWKKELELELPDDSSIEDALSTIDASGEAKKKGGFAVIGDKRVGLDYILSDGDRAKIFARAFGG